MRAERALKICSRGCLSKTMNASPARAKRTLMENGLNIAFFAAAAAIALCADELTRDRRELATELLALRRDRVLEPTLFVESFELISHSTGLGLTNYESSPLVLA